MHFTKYPPNPAYAEYNLETILIANPLARTREIEYIGREGNRIEVLPLLFKDKYNYLPAYFVPMTLPLTPQPDRPMETPTTAETTSTQLFGVVYITLTGMVDTMAPNSGPWSLLGQSVSYIIKLAPILWWALPSGLAVFCPEPTNASTYAWLPDTTGHCVAKSIAVMMYFFSLCFPGIGPTISRAHTLKGSCVQIGSTDLGGVLLFAILSHTPHWSKTS
ncbi:hypothetical protein DSO57_1009956 [Entomophthora muscae]|uniref:Uncharacterized protein n=1 Tax=Entomophthora muscae TaxID=34485 RepID=A0ACC2UG53_9FUNG|nr:hypothetical protein DSO57_1009956 [Entomophthora muscae]